MLDILTGAKSLCALVGCRLGASRPAKFLRSPGRLTLVLVVLLVGAIAPEVAVAGLFSGCQGAKERCGLISGSCCGSMRCELTAWPPECRHAPPRKGEACTIFSGCAGSDLYCKGFQDGLAGRCTEYSKLGEACDGIVTLCGDNLSCRHDPRAIPVAAHIGEGRCFPANVDGWEWDDDESCLAAYSGSLHRSLPFGSGGWPGGSILDATRAMTFGTGAAATIILGMNEERGGVYGSDGSYGCYRSQCVLNEGSIGVSAFYAVGQYENYEDVDGYGFQVYGGATAILGASRGAAWNIDPSMIDPDDPSLGPVGEFFAWSFGPDIGAAVGGAGCDTTVNTVVSNWDVVGGPDARCRDSQACADGPTNCSASVSIDDGSTASDGSAPVLEQIPAGPYSIGETQVTLRASDATGSSDECTALVDVDDCTPPALTCRETVAECEANGQAFVEPIAPAVDECTAYSVAGPPAQDYPLGRTAVEFTVTDAYLNESSCETNVTIVDTTAPEIVNAVAQPALLWPPNHRMQRVEIQVDVMDACDPNARCWVTSVESSEPDRVWWRRKDQAGDSRIVGPTTVELRAERIGNGSNRTYAVHYECADTTAGNVSHGQVQVVVPHDQGRK